MRVGWHASGTRRLEQREVEQRTPDSGGKSMFRISLAAGVLALAGLAWASPAYADDTLRLSLPAKGLSAGVDAPTLTLDATNADLDAKTIATASRGFHGGARGFHGGFHRGFHGGFHRGFHNGF